MAEIKAIGNTALETGYYDIYKALPSKKRQCNSFGMLRQYGAGGFKPIFDRKKQKAAGAGADAIHPTLAPVVRFRWEKLSHKKSYDGFFRQAKTLFFYKKGPSPTLFTTHHPHEIASPTSITSADFDASLSSVSFGTHNRVTSHVASPVC